jgi:sugar/nucleoside kinase (ribokinase family)
MSVDDPFGSPRSSLVAVGTGLLALDVIVRKGAEHLMRERAGGTCGNVLTVLSYLGWSSLPVARIGADSAGDFILAEYARWGVKLDFVDRNPEVRTPVFIHKITRTDSGGAVHGFSGRCLKCGRHLPSYRSVLAERSNELAELLPQPTVFFFDRVSRGAIILAKECRRRGAIIIFEPSSIRDPQLFEEAVSVSHILKYSGERLGGAGLGKLRGPLMTIETNGARGLRYRSKLEDASSKGWVPLSAFPAPIVRDAAGSGDWCTAGILHIFGRSGFGGLLSANEEEILGAIRFGQALAAMNCAHEGALGAMYDLEPDALRAKVFQVMSGEIEEEEEPVDENLEFLPSPHHCASCGSAGWNVTS